STPCRRWSPPPPACSPPWISRWSPAGAWSARPDRATPRRYRRPTTVLRELAEPRSCTEVAGRLDQTPQRVYYHVRRLAEAGLVDQVAERKVRGIQEGIYQARARAYWLSPRLVGRIGLRNPRDELSLG